MRISGITVCVGYADYLAQSIERWIDYPGNLNGLDEWIIVTTPQDHATRELCQRYDLKQHLTDVFHANGAAFNKAAAMDEALAVLRPKEWVAFIDADVIPPIHWLFKVETLAPSPGSLYGGVRTTCTGNRIIDTELAGFFQLWHASDPVTQEWPLLGSWHNASAYDSEFMRRWPAEKRVILPVTFSHLGLPGVNWCGRDNPLGMSNMRAARRENHGYQHERINYVG
jgi:hypothetical protein